MNFWHLIYRVYDAEYLANATKVKASIIDKVLDDIGFRPTTVLFAAYNPIAELMADHYDVHLPADQMQFTTNKLISQSPAGMKFDCVIALDELLTYQADENSQRAELERLADSCNGWLITTLMDYKNLAPYKKNQVEVLHDYKSDATLLEQNSADPSDKQKWSSYFYAITDHENLDTYGPISRRTMYFKQLAKYASDLGSTNYIVQKNTLYRGFGRKHWEHIITIRF